MWAAQEQFAVVSQTGLDGGQRAAALKVLAAPSQAVEPVDDREGYIEAVRQALYASKVVAYAQGFDQIAAGALQHGWQIDLGALATGTALVALGAGGMVNVDHKLQAATPKKPAHPAARGTCPGRHHNHRLRLQSDS